MAQVWIVRAGQDDEYEHEVFDQGVVAMGWRRIGDLTGDHSHRAINSLVDGAYPEFSARSRQEYGAQLYAFRSRMRVGDYVVLVRRHAPDLAIGTVRGDYGYRPDLPAAHVRPVRWVRTDLTRAEIGVDLLAAPALTSIYKVNRKGAGHRLTAIVASTRDGKRVGPVHLPEPDQVSAGSAMDNFRRNLEYAHNLATAGQSLQDLKVQSFDVTDVYRAAWVQAVSALDHWVHQEIRERMLVQLEQTPAGLRLPSPLAEQLAAGSLTAAEALDQHWKALKLGRDTFVQPHKIARGLSHVADLDQLWARVAAVLTERPDAEQTYAAADVETRLKDIAFRRNKIAHEYDEDPERPPSKRPVDGAATTGTINWIGQVAEAIVVVLDGGS